MDKVIDPTAEAPFTEMAKCLRLYTGAQIEQIQSARAKHQWRLNPSAGIKKYLQFFVDRWCAFEVDELEAEKLGPAIRAWRRIGEDRNGEMEALNDLDDCLQNVLTRSAEEQFDNDWQLGVLPEAEEAAFEGIPELERSPSEESLVISSL